MQTIFRRYFPQRSFSLQVFCYCLKLRLRTVLRITISLLKCRCSLRLVQGSPFSYTASIDSNSSSCFALTHFSFSAGLRSSQSIRCAYFPSGHSYAPSLIDSTFPFSLSLKKGAYQTQSLDSLSLGSNPETIAHTERARLFMKRGCLFSAAPVKLMLKGIRSHGIPSTAFPRRFL